MSKDSNNVLNPLVKLSEPRDKFITDAATGIIREFEGCRLNPYLDSGGRPTIGWGSTFYLDGRRVSMKDEPISQTQADELLDVLVNNVLRSVDNVTKPGLNADQYAALISFTYNVGVYAFSTSTLLKLVNDNRNNPAIRNEFLRWVNDNGKKVSGLVRRRRREADLYFSFVKEVV